MFFLHKEWQDPEDGIETVILHWIATPLAEEPRWKKANQMVMVAQPGTYPVLRRCSFEVRPPFSSTRVVPVESGRNPEGFLVHHFFEIVQRGRTWSTEVSQQEMRALIITHSDPSTECTQASLYYSFDPLEHVYRVPMLLEGLPAKYQCLPMGPAGTHSARDDKARAKRYALVARLPPPHAFHAPIWGPAETRVRYAVYFSREGAYNPFSEGGFWLLNEGGLWEVQL